MLVDFRIIAACCALIVGLMVAWANPTRRLNRSFLLFSLFVTAWLFAQWFAGNREHGLWWVRTACAIAVGVVLMMWLVKQTAAEPERTLPLHLRTMIPWVVVGAILVWICFTPYFVPDSSTDERRLYGWGYFVYISTIAAMVLGIAIQTVWQIRALSGVRRLELQLLLLGSVAAAAAVVILMALGAITGNSAFNRAESVFVIAFYAVTSWTIVTTRVLDARYVVGVGGIGLIESALTALVAWSVYSVADAFMPSFIAFMAAASAGLGFVALLRPILQRFFQVHQTDAESRRAAYEVSRRESRPDQLKRAFLKVLTGWSKSEHAIILTGAKTEIEGCGIMLANDGAVVAALRQLRWASPERLARERPTPARRELSHFLEENSLGLLAISEGPALVVVVGVGVAATRRPFTYPQANQLLELASIIESAMERAHFAVKVQHAEQLATVGLLGASVAHEIRNPLVSIKTFVQLLPTHHHDPRFRDKFFKLIGDEVGRIDQLTEQLLDLASPRAYEAKLIDLHPLLESSLDLVAAKAAHRNVQFLTEFHASPDAAYTDASAAKQVMLNLCFNAIQAVEGQAGAQRWVKIVTKNVAQGIEMAVADSGPGIPPEIRPKLFQPFQTTKSTGFGLGLAICSDILSNLHASISVDPPVPGCGATFRVTFPCQPS